MQHHDQVAELRALHAERGNYLAAGRAERAEQVSHQIAGVRAALTDRINQLGKRAAIATAQGADMRAGEATEQARELQAALDELEGAEQDATADPDDLARELQEQLDETAEVPEGEQAAAGEPLASETTAESAPRETATTRRGGRGKGA